MSLEKKVWSRAVGDGWSHDRLRGLPMGQAHLLPQPCSGLCTSSALAFCALQWSISLQPAVLLCGIWMFSDCHACFLDGRDFAFLLTPENVDLFGWVEFPSPLSALARWLV